MTFLPSGYEENFLWKSLLIAVVAVRDVVSFIEAEPGKSSCSTFKEMCVFCAQPYLQCILLLFILRWLEIHYGGRTMKNDEFCR